MALSSNDDDLRDRVERLRRDACPLFGDPDRPRMYRLRSVGLREVDRDIYVDLYGYTPGDSAISMVFLHKSLSLIDVAADFDGFCRRHFVNPALRALILQHGRETVTNAAITSRAAKIIIPLDQLEVRTIENIMADTSAR